LKYAQVLYSITNTTSTFGSWKGTVLSSWAFVSKKSNGIGNRRTSRCQITCI